METPPPFKNNNNNNNKRKKEKKKNTNFTLILMQRFVTIEKTNTDDPRYKWQSQGMDIL